MALGPILDVPIMSGVFALQFKYGKRIASFLIKSKIPKIVLAVLVSIPLLSFEENINCGAFECKHTLWPPTLWFLIIEGFLFLLIIRKTRLKTVFKQTLAYAIYGMLFEITIGQPAEGLRSLLAANPIVFVLIMLWVGISYAFVIYLPLLILNQTENADQPRQV
jgi:hypothetical protein